MKRTKKLVTFLGACLLMIGTIIGIGVPANAAPASYTSVSVAVPQSTQTVSGTLSGDVQCSYGSYNNIVGVWVAVPNGTSGYATRTNDGVGGNYWSYSLTQSVSSYTLHIGCGGTEANWAHTYYITLTANNQNVYCVDTCTVG